MVDHNAQWPQPSQKKTLKFLSVMAGKSPLLKQTLIVCVLLVFVAVAVYAFFNPSDASGLVIPYYSRSYEGISGNSPKVRVYMYDLPRKFTYGIIEQRTMTHVADVSSLKYPGHQHMGEWYIFSDMNRPEEDRVGSPVVRVTDPDEADLFYVPVFSSLSTRVNIKSDEEMQEELAEWLEKQEYWKRNNGWDHVIPAGDPKALIRVMDRVKNAVLLVSCLDRLRPDKGSLVKDVIIPYSRMVKICKDDLGVQNRKTLLFFMGNRFGKQGGKIRDLLFNVLETEEDVIIKHGKPSIENRLATIQGMYTSKFCLNAAGDTASARRLFDSIVSLCVPVIVSDEIELPFEDVIDYRKIAVFVETSEAPKPGFLASTLRGVTTERIIEYQKELREVQRYFRYDHPNGSVNEIWREVSQKLPLIKLMINRDKRLVRRQPSASDCSCLCTNKTGIISTL